MRRAAVQPREARSEGGLSWSWAAASASSNGASSSQRRETTQGPRSPSTRNVAPSDAALWWRFRQPSRQTAARSFQRRLSPVSRTSSPSAKLDLPEPLRPTTRVSPGPACSSRVCRGPIPRNPSTVTERRKAPDSAGDSRATTARGEAAPPESSASSASRPSRLARTRPLHASEAAPSPSSRDSTRFLMPGSMGQPKPSPARPGRLRAAVGTSGQASNARPDLVSNGIPSLLVRDPPPARSLPSAECGDGAALGRQRTVTSPATDCRNAPRAVHPSWSATGSASRSRRSAIRDVRAPRQPAARAGREVARACGRTAPRGLVESASKGVGMPCS